MKRQYICRSVFSSFFGRSDKGSQLCFDPSNVLGLKRSPCSLEVLTYSAACQCFCKSRSTLFVLIRRLYPANLGFPALFMQTPKKQHAALGEPVTRGCSVPEHAPLSQSARQPPLFSLARILLAGFE